MLNIAIVEDEADYNNLLKTFLVSYSEENRIDLKIEQFSNGFDFLKECDEHRFNIVFMDIMLPKCDGLEISRRFRKIDSSACLIFVTNMAQHAINGYDVGALNFLVKPVTYTNFCLKLVKAIRIQTQIPNKSIALKNGTEVLFIPELDIYYIESFAHDLIYHTKRGTLTMRQTMNEAENSLSKSSFNRCHKSFIVNIHCVTRVEAHSIFIMENNVEKEIPLGRSKRNEFMKIMLNMINGD